MASVFNVGVSEGAQCAPYICWIELTEDAIKYRMNHISSNR